MRNFLRSAIDAHKVSFLYSSNAFAPARGYCLSSTRFESLQISRAVAASLGFASVPDAEWSRRLGVVSPVNGSEMHVRPQRQSDAHDVRGATDWWLLNQPSGTLSATPGITPMCGLQPAHVGMVVDGAGPAPRRRPSSVPRTRASTGSALVRLMGGARLARRRASLRGDGCDRRFRDGGVARNSGSAIVARRAFDACVARDHRASRNAPRRKNQRRNFTSAGRSM